MKVETLKTMADQLIACTQGQIGNLSEADSHELGEAVDMIKDFAEAIYYCTITEAMEKSENKEQQPVNNITYYTTPMYAREQYGNNYNRNMERTGGYMYYPTGRNGETTYGGNMDRVNMLGNGGRTSYYAEFPEMRDPREGRSPMRRRMYMEGKEAHNDPNSQLKELEAYLQELSTDITEMIKDASPEERATLHQKMTMLASKIA